MSNPLIVTSVEEMRKISKSVSQKFMKVGLVPTMGYLHEGHLSLVKLVKEKSDYAVVSIFINPTQFAPNEDLNAYPRDFDRDFNLLSDLDVDAIFYPTPEEIYGNNFQTFVNVDELSKKLEGEFRPTHFKGVTTVVNILFNSVRPDFAAFGQKDAQQLEIIKRMNRDLKIGVEILCGEIIREADGLAMSSRNVYLNESERKEALCLHKAIQRAKSMISDNVNDVNTIKVEALKILNSEPSAKPDYAEIVETDTFKEALEIEKGKSYYILIACRIGKTRLIDNEIVIA